MNNILNENIIAIARKIIIALKLQKLDENNNRRYLERESCDKQAKDSLDRKFRQSGLFIGYRCLTEVCRTHVMRR